MRQIWWVRTVVVFLLAFLNHQQCCHCCLEEERIALFNIKTWIDPKGLVLNDWVDDRAECCEFSRIVCDVITDRVTAIDFDSTWNKGLGDLYLNASLFFTFKDLNSLVLSSNNLVSSFDDQGFEVLPSKLTKLEELYLGYNKFNDSILLSLVGFSSLTFLDLSQNMLTASTDLKGFEILSSKLTKLEVLSLSNNNLNDSILSSLVGFSSLKHLDLSENALTASTTSSKGFEVLSSKLTKLEELNLGKNEFNGSIILSSLNGFSSLKILSLMGNMLTASTYFKGFHNLTNLEELYLDENSLSTNIFHGIRALSALKILSLRSCDLHGTLPTQEFYNLSNLEQLYLDDNSLSTSILRSIGALSALKYLSLKNCTLNGTLPTKGWCQMRNLKYLDISNNNLDGSLPYCLENLSSIQELYLNDNQFTGNIDSSPLTNLTSLEDLNLSDNNFKIPTSFKTFANHTNLKSLGCDNSKLIDEPTFPNVTLRFQLQYFTLANCTSKAQKVEIPKFLYNQYGLYYLDLSHNSFSGMFPAWLFENNTDLGEIYLGDNYFEGILYATSHPIVNQYLRVLNINNNQLRGMLPGWIANMSSLEVIDLSKNHFEGPIPRAFCKLDQLKYVGLSNNLLSGSIPSCFKSKRLSHVHLSKNHLSGPLTDTFYNSSSLVTLDIGYNNLTGIIPSWIGTISRMSVLILRANNFEGELPSQLCLLQQLSMLDVSQNKLVGPLPSCFGNLTFNPIVEKASLHLLNGLSEWSDNSVVEGVEFTTKDNPHDYKGYILNHMSGLDFSSNRFIGEIPPEFGNLSEIHALNLSHNNLVGQIPGTFSGLKQIESLDLSHNNLDGELPPQLTQLTTLEAFSVAYNNLSGKAPERKNQFGTFDRSSYEGNPLLCGPPLQNSYFEIKSAVQPIPQDSNNEREDDSPIDMDVFYVSFVVCYIIMLLIIVGVLYINPYWRRMWFYFIQDCIDTCYYFVLDCYYKIF